MVNSFLPTDPEPSTNEEPASQPFQTPDEVAAADLKPSTNVPVSSVNPPKADSQHFIGRLKARWHNLSKKKKIIAVVVASLILLALIGGLVFALTRHPSPQPKAAAKAAVPKSTTVPSNLTGLPVAPSVNRRPVTAVMIENSLDARPQSGLNEAGVVFEAVAEGGITRFLALFQDSQPSYIGPVRSARPYYVQWALGFDAAYAHVGGSPDALSDIPAWHVKDLNEFYNAGAYERIASREAPHNVYTSIAQLAALEKSKHIGTSHFTSFPRKADSPAKQPTAASIALTLSGPDYNVNYTYNPAQNDYNRSEGGESQLETSRTGKLFHITPKVVIAIVVPEHQGALDALGAYYSDYQAIGSGKVYIFQDGIVTTGTWHKSSNTAQITFTDASGQPIKLNAGQTWITAVASSDAVTYKP